MNALHQVLLYTFYSIKCAFDQETFNQLKQKRIPREQFSSDLIKIDTIKTARESLNGMFQQWDKIFYLVIYGAERYAEFTLGWEPVLDGNQDTIQYQSAKSEIKS